MATKFIHFEGIISHTHTRKVFLLIYLNYDVVLSRCVLQYMYEKGATLFDVIKHHEMTFSDLIHLCKSA